MTPTYKMPNIYKISGISRLLMFITYCGLSTAQMLYVGDFCDFAGYNGICREASKCSDLKPIMQSLGYKSDNVGRCGYTIREEIICCPIRPTPVQTPPILSNDFIDLSQRPEFDNSPPPDSVFNPNSFAITTSTPIISNQKSNNNQERVQFEDKKLWDILNSNFYQAGNANNNIVFGANPVSNVFDENQRINDIFNVDRVSDVNERLNAIFSSNSGQPGNGLNVGQLNGNSAPIGNGNNNGMLRANPVSNVQDNEKLNSNPIFDENQRINDIFNVDRVSDVNERLNAIFSSNSGQPGNGLNVGQLNGNSAPLANGNNNGLFGANVKKNQNINDKPVNDELLKAIFSDSVQFGNGDRKVQWRQRSIPVENENNKRNFNANLAPIPIKAENIDSNAAWLNKSIQDTIFNADLNRLGSNSRHSIRNYQEGIESTSPNVSSYSRNSFNNEHFKPEENSHRRRHTSSSRLQ